MKWNYKDCKVEVMVVYAANLALTPVVRIDCKENARRPHTLVTHRTFSIPVEAEDFGANMARDWIDKHWESEEELD